MIRVRIDDILNERGLTRYWLTKQMDGPSYQNVCKILDNKTSGIKFNTLELLMKTLNCSMDDLFEII